MSVTFTPTASGTRSGQLTVPSDAAGSPHVVALSGSGYAPVPAASVSPTSIGFGSLWLGTATSARLVTLTSTGTAPLVVGAVRLGGANPGDFWIWEDHRAGSTLIPGASCTLQVGFGPMAVGHAVGDADARARRGGRGEHGRPERLRLAAAGGYIP